MPKRLLIIEDEPALVESLERELRCEGYEVLSATDGHAGLNLALEETPDLVILDLTLPGMGGVEVCRAIRWHLQVPILMLRAEADQPEGEAGQELGADDYVSKPLSTGELAERVRALLERAEGWQTPAQALKAGEVEMDLAKHEVRVAGKPVRLSPMEFDLLAMLMQRRGHVLSRQMLLREVWGDDEWHDPHMVDMHVGRLREKIEQDPSQPRRIATVPGFGYKFAE